jgi:hypothetical protein
MVEQLAVTSTPSGASTVAPIPAHVKEMRIKLRQRALDKVYRPRPAPTVFPLGSKLRTLYPFVRETIKDVPMTYLEFGVFKGQSLGRMVQLFKNPETRFYGFDSFMGLPEDWYQMEAGTFSTGGEEPAFKDSRVEFVKGYFQNSLPAFLSTFSFRSPVLVHFDADLYSSTLFLLALLWPHLPEFYFIYDEFVQDEVVALHDFSSAFPVELQFFACTGADGKSNSPQQLFGFSKNIPFKI